MKIKDSFTKRKIEVIIFNKSVLWNIPHTDASSMYLETCLKDRIKVLQKKSCAFIYNLQACDSNQ